MDSKSPDERDLDGSQHARVLMYAGLVLVAYELMKSMIVEPIKLFYADMTFGSGMPFKSYDEDVKFRHKNEFEACLLYLKDFMEAIDADDFDTIQALRKHRNEIAHDLVSRIEGLEIQEYEPMFEKVNRTLFKLSNYRTYMEIGADPEFRGIDWDSVAGHEYILFKEIATNIKILSLKQLP